MGGVFHLLCLTTSRASLHLCPNFKPSYGPNVRKYFNLGTLGADLHDLSINLKQLAAVEDVTKPAAL